MHICPPLFFFSLVFLVSVNCISLLPHIGSKWTFRFRKRPDLNSLIHDLTDYRLHQPTVSDSPVVKQDVSDQLRTEALKRFYQKQQNLFLKELVIPCIKSIKSKCKPSKQSEPKKHTSKGSRVWEYRVSDKFNKLKCSVLSEVPEGTVVMRPKNTNSDFISLPALNTLFRTRANVLKILFPKNDIKDLNELHRYASFKTALVSQLCSNDRVRKTLVTLSLLMGLKLSKEVLLDLFFLLIRSNIFWNKAIYSIWSQSLSFSLPLLLVTANGLMGHFFSLLSLLDERLLEALISAEGTMLNRDLRERFRVHYVKDERGTVRVHDNYFEV